MPGTLFVVGTPIGNLEDLTFRALRVLKEADVIAAEDTRRTARLLAHYDIRKPLLSVREHNEARETPRILERLRTGTSVALVTDAGTPGISDPGARLVRAVRDAGLDVVPVPGPSAVVAALSVSGVSGDGFSFMGFPPRSGTARREWLAELSEATRPVVFFEAPHRILRTLRDIESDVKRPIYVLREITKKFEEFVKWNNKQVDASISEAGEFTVVVDSDDHPLADRIDGETASDLVGRITDCLDLSEQDALRMASVTLKCRPSSLRKALKRHAILVKRQTGASP